MEATILTVTQVNTYVRSLLESQKPLQEVFLRGEISNFTNHYKSGHLYFSLKDERCTIKAVMFAKSAARLRFAPEDGLGVIARGRISLYEQTGQYQFYAEEMQPDGLGALNLAFEQLKKKLAAEGLFERDRKKKIPEYPDKIGVITSPTGAAVRDIFEILKRRWPLAEIVFCPVLVQGENAAAELAGAVKKMNLYSGADVILIGRGGGSIENLWAFNEEVVARAVAMSDIPVISAVGHETDFTICDFVADLRAPTPSAAAELATPDLFEELQRVDTDRLRLKRSGERKLRELSERYGKLVNARALQHPEEMLAIRKMSLDTLYSRLGRCSDKTVSDCAARVSAAVGKLSALNPLEVLGRGYAIVEKEGRIVKSVSDLQEGNLLSVRVSDGSVRCEVKEI